MADHGGWILTLVGVADARPSESFRAVDAEAIARVLAEISDLTALSER